MSDALPRAFRLSRAGYYLDHTLAPSFAGALIGADLVRETPLLTIALFVVVGFVLWTLAEYLIHRFAFHGPLRALHDVHHRRPSAYIGVASWGTAAAFTSAWGALALAAELPTANAITAGILLGYLAYIVVHDRMHHGDRTQFGPWMRSRFARHAAHHRGGHANFGVTTALWDHVYHTYR